jgi:hypothetical protein
MTFTCALAAGFQFDTPYGKLTLENSGIKWDVPLTREELLTTLRQFDAVQESPTWFVSLNCDVAQAGLLMDVLKEAGYLYIDPIFWHKTGQSVTSTRKQFTRSVELVIVGRKTREGVAA